MPDPKVYDKRGKSHGREIVCPVCSNKNGPFDAQFGIVTVFTCPNCATQFDSDGKTGPFTRICQSCNTEQPQANSRCYMCGHDLDRPQVDLGGPEQIYCGNCHEPNPKGAGSCRRCGQHISGIGEVIRVG